jgi:hypothetical protein
MAQIRESAQGLVMFFRRAILPPLALIFHETASRERREFCLVSSSRVVSLQLREAAIFENGPYHLS